MPPPRHSATTRPRIRDAIVPGRRAGPRGWLRWLGSLIVKARYLPRAGAPVRARVRPMQPTQSPVRWEYSTVPLLVHATKQILDNWGDDGWELVAVVPGPSAEQLVAYLKRPKAGAS